MEDAPALRDLLDDIDGRGYGAWKRLKGDWALGSLRLEVEKVQADPFAPPTRLALRCPPERLGLPEALVATPVRRRALADHLLRVLAPRLEDPLRIDVGGQQVLARTAATLHPDGALDLRPAIELPDRRRKVRARPVAAALLETLPAAVDALAWDVLDRDAAETFVATVEDATALRAELARRDLVAFVGDGAVLARRSGVDDRPAPPEAAIPFDSPDQLRVSVELPNRGTVTGMGVGTGVTVVVGGGFHGKSTLLDALRAGVYDHVPGDGRELVITRDDAVTVRAEDGRRVEQVDISSFVAAVPDATAMARGAERGDARAVTRDTTAFCSDDASGSTSQAAGIVEAVEAGTGLLLIDEDTAATNLMVRDRRMEALIRPADDQAYAAEPITPYVDLVRSLADDHGVSTIVVIGAVGDYLEVADRVVQLDAFRARDVTDRARALAAELPGRTPAPATFAAPPRRVADPASVDPRKGGKVKTRVLGRDRLLFGRHELDLTALEQLVDRGQVAGVAAALVRLGEDGHLDGRASVGEAVAALFADVEAHGLEALRAGWPGDLAQPRPAEVAAALNRLRSLRVTATRPR